MNSDLELVQRLAGPQSSLTVKIDEWPKTIRLAANETGKARRQNQSMTIGRVAYFFALLFRRARTGQVIRSFL